MNHRLLRTTVAQLLAVGILLAGLGSAAWSQTTPGTSGKKSPNIIVILADDK